MANKKTKEQVKPKRPYVRKVKPGVTEVEDEPKASPEVTKLVNAIGTLGVGYGVIEKSPKGVDEATQVVKYLIEKNQRIPDPIKVYHVSVEIGLTEIRDEEGVVLYAGGRHCLVYLFSEVPTIQRIQSAVWSDSFVRGLPYYKHLYECLVSYLHTWGCPTLPDDPKVTTVISHWSVNVSIEGRGSTFNDQLGCLRITRKVVL